MYGELTDKETMARIDESLEKQLHDQLEVLLYKKNSKLFVYAQLSSIKLHIFHIFYVGLN